MIRQLLTFIRGIREEMISQEPTKYAQYKDAGTFGTLLMRSHRGMNDEPKVMYVWTVLEQQTFDFDWEANMSESMQAAELIIDSLITKLDQIANLASRPPAPAPQQQRPPPRWPHGSTQSLPQSQDLRTLSRQTRSRRDLSRCPRASGGCGS